MLNPNPVMAMDKWVWILLVVVFVVAVSLFIATRPRKSDAIPINEPPVKEQIDQQLSALNSGVDIPLPIPIVIDNNEITKWDIKQVESSLVKAEFKEQQPSKEEKDLMIFGLKWTTYGCMKNGLVATITYGIGDEINLSISSNSSYEIDGYYDSESNSAGGISTGAGNASDGSADYGKFGIGPIRLGMSESQVKSSLYKLPHDSMKKGQIETMRNSNYVRGLSASEGGEVLADIENTTYLARGLYRYEFLCEGGRLVFVRIWNMGNGILKEPFIVTRAPTEKEKRNWIRKQFD